MRSFMVACLIFIGSLTIGAAFGETLEFYGVRFPETVAGFTRAQTIDYESNSPGLGYAVKYSSRGWSIDVIIYDFGFKDIPDLLSSDRVTGHFTKVQGDILRVWKAAGAKVEEKQPFDITAADHTVRFICRAYVVQKIGQREDSYLCLTTYKGKFVKYRVTAPEWEGNAEKARHFMATWIDLLWPATDPSTAAQMNVPTDNNVKLKYSSWTKSCTRDVGNQNCISIRTGNAESLVLSAALLIERGGESPKILRVFSPIGRGVAISQGTRVFVDSSQALGAPFAFCLAEGFAEGCVADYVVTPELFNLLRRGKTLFIQVIKLNGTTQTLPFPLDEFDNVYGGAPTDTGSIASSVTTILTALSRAESKTENAAGRIPANVNLVYSPWTKFCLKEANARQVCPTSKVGRTESGQYVIEAGIFEAQGEPKKILRVTLPLGTQLVRGIRVVIDNNPPMQGPYAACFRNGCVSDFEVTPDFLESLRKGESLVVEALYPSGEPLKRVLPLKDGKEVGFAKAVDGPPSPQAPSQQRINTAVLEDGPTRSYVEKYASANWLELRLAYADSPGFDAGLKSVMERKAMNDAMSAGDFQKVISLAKSLLDQNSVDIDANLSCDLAYQNLGRPELARGHRMIWLGLLQSIIGANDGRSHEKAFEVITVSEERFVLNALRLKGRSQAYVKHSDHLYDVWTASDSNGTIQTIYFNVDRMSRAEAKLFQSPSQK
jgi:invasion protein IalB